MPKPLVVVVTFKLRIPLVPTAILPPELVNSFANVTVPSVTCTLPALLNWDGLIVNVSPCVLPMMAPALTTSPWVLLDNEPKPCKVTPLSKVN